MTTLPFTLRSAADLPSNPPPLSKSALLIIDAQREYGPDGNLALPHIASAIDHIRILTERSRSAGAAVIHVVHQGKPGGLFDPGDGGRMLAEIEPAAGEPIVSKTLPNAFADTDLADQLAALNNPPLVIVGFMTHMCVSSTARSALDRGLSTTVIADATATRTLPAPVAGDVTVSAEVLQRGALAALADRFSIVTTSDTLT